MRAVGAFDKKLQLSEKEQYCITFFFTRHVAFSLLMQNAPNQIYFLYIVLFFFFWYHARLKFVKVDLIKISIEIYLLFFSFSFNAHF